MNKILQLLLGFTLAAPAALAQKTNFFSDIFSKAWTFILKAFSLNFLGNQDELAAFARILIFLLLIIVLQSVLTNTPRIGGQGGILSRKAINIISVIIAIMSAIIFPKELLLTILTAYGTLTATMLLGTVVFVFGYLGFVIVPSAPRPMLMLRTIILLIGMGVLWTIQAWAEAGAGVRP
jgi:hypothetical protein